jgi:hypothetical protein
MLGKEVCQTERRNSHFSNNHNRRKTQSVFESHCPGHFQHQMSHIVKPFLFHFAPLMPISKIFSRRLVSANALPLGVMIPVLSRMNGWIALFELILVLASVRSINLLF